VPSALPRFAAVLALALAASIPAGAAASTATDEMARCAAFGPKRPGNAAGRAMAGHIAQRFRAAGLQTATEDFHLPVYTVRGVSLEVLGPNPRRVPGETFAYGGTGTVAGEVVDVGIGRAADYLGKDARGKIVMVDRNEAFHRTSQLQEVVAHGGSAMLYVSGSPDNLVQTGTVRFAQDVPAGIPAVTVGSADGAGLRRELRTGALRMRIRVDADREDAVGRNVIGIAPGATYPERLIVVGGHYDSWHGGAVDNCSAIGSMLGILDALKGRVPAYTLVFAAWDAEEIGLVGSYDWVMRHPDLVRRTVLNENLEMTSAATYVGAARLDYSAVNLIFGTTSPAMNAIVYQAAGRNLFAPAPTTAAGVRSVSGGIIPTDLQPFYALGVHGFSTFSSTPYYHTIRDDADKIDPASHERVTAVMRDVLEDVQRVSPEVLAPYREIPSVVVSGPATARPGSAVRFDVTVSDPLGRAVTGARVRVLVNQRDHWAVDHGIARELGGGLYTYTVAAGRTEADRTWVTATVDQPAFIAQGFATVDQRAGGVLAAKPNACTSRRRLVLHVRNPRRGERVTRVRARTTHGKLRVRGRRVIVDLRGARRATVRVTVVVRTSRGRTMRQSRTYRTCVSRQSRARYTRPQ
jgi:hypothetical protein